ncbi:MAG: hypothetical protein ABSF59_16080 [Candidatus Sulfotelmatobacter sp.]|jgi:hypothetical protein
MKHSPDSMLLNLVQEIEPRPFPQELHGRLAARAVTAPDVASMMALFTKLDEAVSERPLDRVIEDDETLKLGRGQLICPITLSALAANGLMTG